MHKLLAILLTASASVAMAENSGPVADTPAFTGVSETLMSIASRNQSNLDLQLALQSAADSDSAKSASSPAASPSAAKSASSPVASAINLPMSFIAPQPTPLPYLQTATFQNLVITPGASFEGLGKGTPGFNVAGAPSGATIGVSPTQVVQWLFGNLAVYDKTGIPLLAAPGYITSGSIWTGLGAASRCATSSPTSRESPRVQFDRTSQRWVLTQTVYGGNVSSAQCFAVSQTADATGAYHLYEYDFGAQLAALARLGVWTDGYYVAYNVYVTRGSFVGARSCAYDKAAMLVGAVATQVCFTSASRFSFLPGDLDGTTLPPAGAPNPQISWNWAFTGAAPYTMQLTKFKPNFVTPALSTFDDGIGGATFSSIDFPLDSSTIAACSDIGRNCVPQLGTANVLDSRADSHNFRVVYRNFGTHDALLVTQAVDPSTPAVAAVRWWEIRNPSSNAPFIHQNSTYAPDAESRWMSSAAFDKRGNIAMAYTASSATTHPSIKLTGRLRIDPKNLMRSEIVVQAGTGSQTGTLQRWGDSSTMQIDPADDCTFWYTSQYLVNNGSFNWNTRIASYRFPNCQ
jgi:hypothetical protein